MNITNEDKKRIGDSAAAMMLAYCDWKIAEEHLRVAKKLGSSMAGIDLDGELLKSAITPFVLTFKQAQKNFFDALEIGEGHDDFWEWVKKYNEENPPSMEELKHRFDKTFDRMCRRH